FEHVRQDSAKRPRPARCGRTSGRSAGARGEKSCERFGKWASGRRVRQTNTWTPSPARSVFRVALFFHDGRTEARVDLPLDCGAFIVGHVDRSSQINELLVERARALLVADAILDVPQLLVDPAQGGPF